MSTTKKSRPGVMFYFSWLETFEEISPFDTKLLLIAILQLVSGKQKRKDTAVCGRTLSQKSAYGRMPIRKIKDKKRKQF